MIDGRYTDQEWQLIVAAVPGNAAPEGARAELESAARRYLDDRLTKHRMAGSAAKRKRWLTIESRTSDLLALIAAVDHWNAPIWGNDGQIDPKGERAEIEARLKALLHHARENALTYDGHAQRNAGKKNPARTQLNDQVLDVWTNRLGQKSSYSEKGPIVRFFGAVLQPVLGGERPAPGTIRDAIDRREKRAQLTKVPVSQRKAKGRRRRVQKLPELASQ